MYDESTIVVRDKIYVPASAVDVERVQKEYTHFFYDNKACVRCENRFARHNFECDNCAAFKGAVATCSTVYKNGIDYVGLPLGDRLNVERRVGFDMDEFNIIDKRVRSRFTVPVRMRNFELRNYQRRAVDEWLELKHGLIVAPPRSGKTPTMLFMAVDLGNRTIVLANQHEFLLQYIEHIEKYTNLRKLQKQEGVKLYGFPKKDQDFETLQIATCTYQQFLDTENGRRRLKLALPQFGTMQVDEAHKLGGKEFARVANRFPVLFRMGVTGTDRRKDNKHILLRDVIGGAASRIEIPQLVAKVLVHVCDFVKTRSQFRGPAGFTYCCKFLGRHKKRTELILEYIERDLNNGHSIVIPVYHRDHVDLLVKLINDMMGEKIAEPFVGGGSKKNKDVRAATLERARSGKTRVVVGIRSIIQLGLNIPRWSALYYIQPMSNEPNWKQESSRILTPMKGKRQPIIRMFVDPNVGMSLGCFVSTFKSTLKFKHEPTKEAKKRAMQMFELHGSKYSKAAEDLFGDDGDVDAYASYEFQQQDDRRREKTPKQRKSRLRAGKNVPKGLFNRG